MTHTIKHLITRAALAWLRRHSPQSLPFPRRSPPPIDTETWERLLSGVDTKGRGR